MKGKRFILILCTAVVGTMVLSGCFRSSGVTPGAGTDRVTAEAYGEETPKEDGQERETSAEGETGGAKVGNGDEVFALTSLEYVKAMGHGWNLGNSFDRVNTDETEEDKKETAWGNPVVTRELIREVKAKGFDSIRIPMTLFRRYDKETYEIDKEWLARYKEVVDWAVEEGLYVMVNIHHDSWIWLKYWDGNRESQEYVRFVRLWEQLADYLKEEPERVCFETINEPDFEEGSDEEKQAMLDAINLGAYHAIRDSGGNNGARMIVMPTMSTVYDTFTKNDIGVVIGEYGLLGYDKGETCNQPGEELKYYEYMNELARKMDL